MQHNNIRSELEHHHKDCYGWALHCCNRDRELAVEVLQTSYLKILEKQSSYRGSSSFKSWAFIIIKNTAIDAWKKQKKSDKILKNDNSLPDSVYEIGSESNFDKKLRELFFTKALSQLSERQQQILQLMFYHDFSLNESAEILKISQGSVRKHYDRAKKSLAEWFRKNGMEEFK
jgi:RNA polymerase sigma-70 factor (ECF subfamily)